jgi:hypothetical protein
MPVLRFIEPCLPSPADRPPSGSGWLQSTKAIALWRGEIPSASGSLPGARAARLSARLVRRLAQPQSPPDTPGRAHPVCVSHTKTVIGRCFNRALCYLRQRGYRRGADHENDDEGAAFCCAEIGASGQGALERGIAAVSAARARATEIAQQTKRPRLAPIRSQGRRRVERLSALVTSNH